MFRHKGKSRTYIHNLKLASLLSFVAGIVNITGILSVQRLTTNITGHFAYFTQNLSGSNYETALLYLSFVLSFLSGAFVSNLLIEITLRAKPTIMHVFPMIIEIAILNIVGFVGSQYTLSSIGSQVIA